MGNSGCSDTGNGFLPNGAICTSSTNSPACGAGSARPLAAGDDEFERTDASLENEYIKALLLMRLDSGSFTPDQVQWVSRILEEWVAPLTLVPPPGTGANFYIDLSGTQGLKRADKPRAGGRLMFLDTGPVYARIVERMRLLPEQQEEAPAAGRIARA